MMPRRRKSYQFKSYNVPLRSNVLRVVRLHADGSLSDFGFLLPDDAREDTYKAALGNHPEFLRGLFLTKSLTGTLAAPSYSAMFPNRIPPRTYTPLTLVAAGFGTAINHEATCAVWQQRYAVGFPANWIMDQGGIPNDVLVEIPETWSKVTVRGRYQGEIAPILETLSLGGTGLVPSWGEHDFHTIFVREAADVETLRFML